jgi:hypothetical protein
MQKSAALQALLSQHLFRRFVLRGFYLKFPSRQARLDIVVKFGIKQSAECTAYARRMVAYR